MVISVSIFSILYLYTVVNTPRISADGKSTLTSPRTISNSVFIINNGKKVSKPEGFNSLMSLNWGQFLDHDIVLTPTFAGKCIYIYLYT